MRDSMHNDAKWNIPLHGRPEVLSSEYVGYGHQGWFEAMVGPSEVLLKPVMDVSDKARWRGPRQLKPFGNMIMDQGEIHVLQRKPTMIVDL